MDSQRNLIIIAFLFISFLIWQTWEHDKNLQLQQNTTATMETGTSANQNILISGKGKHITVTTNVLRLTINTCGGDIEQALLLKYPKTLKSNEPFSLLETTSDFIYQAQSGLSGRDGPDSPLNSTRPIYNVNKDNFVLTSEQNEIAIPMTYTDSAGNIFTKTFILKQNDYAIKVGYEIQNTSTTKSLEVSNFGQLKQSINLPSSRETENNSFVLHTFRGAAYSTQDSKYEKYKFNTIVNNENLNVNSRGGWIAMLQQYFVTSWIPKNSGINNFYTANLNNGIVAIGYKSQPVLVKPGQTAIFNSTLWIGPEILDEMAAVAPHLDLTVDYGYLWFISQPLFRLLKFIHSFLNNWGFSIIVITFIVRVIMYPLTKAQYTSMAKIRMLQPKIQAMRERLGNDKQRYSQEIMTLYKSENVNPLGGCFPFLIQMPIFLALYYMLMGSVELRHAPFILWICDLSARDPYYTLPILMGITMFFIQKKSSPTMTDCTKWEITVFMPMIFTIFFLWFPSGLVLYYTVSNLVSIIQQQLIYRSLEKSGLHSKEKKKS